MSRDQEVNFEQDRQGNERKKLDTLRAQEGMDAADNNGLKQIVSADTGSDLLLYSLPSHAHEVFITGIHAYSDFSIQSTFTLSEADLNASGSVTSTTQRSVPFWVGSSEDSQIDYDGQGFQKSISVNSDFTGWVGVGVVVDHREFDESATEQTT